METNERVPPPFLSLPRIIIARVSTKGNDFPGGSIILILILILILLLLLLLLLIIIIINRLRDPADL